MLYVTDALVMNYYTQSIVLSNFSTFSFGAYFRSPLVEKHIKEVNAEMKVSTGMLIVFNIKGEASDEAPTHLLRVSEDRQDDFHKFVTI